MNKKNPIEKPVKKKKIQSIPKTEAKKRAGGKIVKTSVSDAGKTMKSRNNSASQSGSKDNLNSKPEYSKKKKSYLEIEFYKRFFYYIIISSLFLGIENSIITLILSKLTKNFMYVIGINSAISLIFMLIVGIILFVDIKDMISLNRFYSERHEKK